MDDCKSDSSGRSTSYRRSGTFSANLEPLRFDTRGRVLINDVTNFDREQFERYLVRPAYVKVLRRVSNCDIQPFKRLFLAQEIRYVPDVIPIDDRLAAGLVPATLAVTTSEFSPDGKYFAVGGQDGSLRVLKVLDSTSEKLTLSDLECEITGKRKIQYAPLFNELEIVVLCRGGTKRELLDVSWSKNNFLLSSSMEQVVKLWSPLNSDTPLMEFPHPDFVTSVQFVDHDDEVFVSGCLDRRVRLWRTSDNKKPRFIYDCKDPVTMVSLSPRGGEITVVGTFRGYIHVLFTEGLKPLHKFHVKQFGQHGHFNSASVQVTGIDWIDSDKKQGADHYHIVVTCSDSRIRLFKISERCYHHAELEGFRSEHYRHRARLYIWDGQPFVYCSSEDQWFYVWRLDDDSMSKSPVAEPRSTFLNMVASYWTSTFLRTRSQTQTQTQGAIVRKQPHTFSFHAHDNPLTTVTIAPRATVNSVTQSNDFIYEFTTRCHFTSAVADDHHSDRDSDSAVTAHEIIGPIIVTTDNTGTIRVFRTDLQDSARDTLIHVLHTAIATGTPTL